MTLTEQLKQLSAPSSYFDMKKIIWVFLLLLMGCSVKAYKLEDGTMILKGWGAKTAKWSDGSEITKEEPIRVPDIAPINMDR